MFWLFLKFMFYNSLGEPGKKLLPKIEGLDAWLCKVFFKLALLLRILIFFLVLVLWGFAELLLYDDNVYV